MLSGTEVALVVVFSVLIVTDLTGNTLVCLVVIKNKCMRTPMNFLLVNLALADMLVALGISLQYVFSHTFSHPQGKAGLYVCKILTGGNLTWLGGLVSEFSLVAIAFERYYAIVYPYLQRGRMTTRKIVMIVIVSWVCATLINFAPFYVMTYSKEQDFCVEEWPRLSEAKFYSMFVFFTDVIFPLSIMGFLYTRIILNLWGKSNRVQSSQDTTRVVVLKVRKKMTKMLLVVTAVYGLCWTPIMLLYVLSYYSPSEYIQYGSNAYNIAIVFVCLNSSINPFVYTLHSEQFRRSFKSILCCVEKRQEVRTNNKAVRQPNVTLQMTRVTIKTANPAPVEICSAVKEGSRKTALE